MTATIETSETMTATVERDGRTLKVELVREPLTDCYGTTREWAVYTSATRTRDGLLYSSTLRGRFENYTGAEHDFRYWSAKHRQA